MLRPQEANVLKESEILWLQESEASLDRALMKGFTGDPLAIYLRVPPFPRTLHILMSHYVDWHWAPINETSHLIQIRISPKAPIARPQFPTASQMTETSEEVVEQAKTAWERIENSD